MPICSASNESIARNASSPAAWWLDLHTRLAVIVPWRVEIIANPGTIWRELTPFCRNPLATSRYPLLNEMANTSYTLKALKVCLPK